MLWALLLLSLAAAPYKDRTFPSKVFGQARPYLIFLPADDAETTHRYPVIYYFHGHSGRYTLERYDHGQDTVPKIARFVAGHGVIVVAVDGHVARHYTGFYGGTPYDVYLDGGTYDFGEHFQELVAHIDGAFRTLTARRVLWNESWSFHFTPDVRSGPEPLYQAFQFHRGHAHQVVWRVPRAAGR